VHQFDRDLMLLLNDVARLLRTRFDQRARARGMTRAQWVILARVDAKPGLSQNELAALLEVEPISVGRLVDRLEARGFLERRADPADRRLRRLHLLPAAAPVLEEITKAREVLVAELLEGVDLEVRSKVVDALMRMKNNLISEPAPLAVGA
jgi:DNA-binding MarR family transcriptional regulator